MASYRAEYIWIDGTKPTPKLRAKTKIVNVGEDPPTWASTVPVRVRPPGSVRTVF